MEDLTGARIVEVGRTLDMAVVGFARDDLEFRLHAQCPFRLAHKNRILLGTRDMYAAKGDFDTAWDQYTTVYDLRAKDITAILAEHVYVVEAADLRAAGALAISATDSLQIDVLPVSSARRREAWRLFVRHDIERHFVYPQEAEEDD